MASNKNDMNNNTKLLNDSLQKKNTEVPLYFASVYRYTCLGHVRASSNEKDDKVCRGIQYGLQHAAESHRTISRKEATEDFGLLNGTAKDRQNLSPGIPDSINDILRTQAIVMNNKPEQQNDKEWNMIDSYGITDVEVLVLQDSKTKKSEVTSVAPHCFVGSSIRHIGTKEGTMMSATVHLGPLEISMDSGLEEAHPNAHAPKHKQKQPRQIPNTPPRHDDSDSQRLDVIQLSKKVADNMVKGAGMLKDAVSEDFPSRMHDAGHRVLAQTGKTVERTGKVAKSLYRVWFDGDDDDDKS